MKCAPIRQELNKTLSKLSVSNRRSPLEIVTDSLVSGYIGQIDYKIVNNAERMADFYKTFFALENDIRDMVEETLEEQFQADWWSKKVPQSVRENVQKKCRPRGIGGPTSSIEPND